MEFNFFKYYVDADTPQKLTDAYYSLLESIESLLKELDPLLYSTSSQHKKRLREIMNTVQVLYDKMSEIQYRVSRVPKNTIVNHDGDRHEAGGINEMAKVWLNLLQFRYLTPLTIRISEYDTKRSFFRDILFLVFSIIISALIGFFVSWGFDSCNDRDLEEIRSRSALDHGIIKKKIDDNSSTLDSLMQVRPENATDNN
jgi:hypothetical protein